MLLAETLYSDLDAWLDVKMADRSEEDMELGVKNCTVFILIVNGPGINPDRPEDPPGANAVFSREYCLKEINWAIQYEKRIQPVVRRQTKEDR